MKTKRKILFITQEITPYVPSSEMSDLGRRLPAKIQEQGAEIRTFMPRWGNINERKNQLHEVIRLSGMNIVIDDTDHPLIIKVASISAARMQVYFIDSEDFFQRKGMLLDLNGQEFADNTSRTIFYARGVLETVKKLRWIPDVIYCQGWASAVVPMFIKTAYRDEPPFIDAKVVFSLHSEQPQATPPERLLDALLFRDVNKELLEGIGIDFTAADSLLRLAIKYCDAVAVSGKQVSADLLAYASELGKPLSTLSADTPERELTALFDQLLANVEM